MLRRVLDFAAAKIHHGFKRMRRIVTDQKIRFDPLHPWRLVVNLIEIFLLKKQEVETLLSNEAARALAQCDAAISRPSAAQTR